MDHETRWKNSSRPAPESVSVCGKNGKIFGVKSDRKSENSWCKSTKVTVIWTKPSPLQSGAPVQTKSRYVDEDNSNVTMVFEVHKTLAIAEGSLEVKLPTIWTDGKCRGGKSQRREEERREEKRKIRRKKSRRERVRRKKMQMR
jgi:hypothetical protein